MNSPYYPPGFDGSLPGEKPFDCEYCDARIDPAIDSDEICWNCKSYLRDDGWKCECGHYNSPEATECTECDEARPMDEEDLEQEQE